MEKFFITLLIIVFGLAFILLSSACFIGVYEKVGFFLTSNCLLAWGIFFISYSFLCFLLVMIISNRNKQ